MLTTADGEAAFVDRNYEKAREIWEPLADGGDAEAEAWLGSLYANGLGTEKDAARAFALYLRSAEKGNPLAANNVAVMYAKGDGVAADPREAASWFRRAAEQGDALGQFTSQARLGYCYAKGLGTAADPVEAFVWFSAAAQHGVGLAMAELEELVRTMSEDQRTEARRRLAQRIGSQAAVRLSA